MATVGDVLAHPAFRRAEVVAGAGGMGRRVAWYYQLEVFGGYPPFETFEPDLFLFTLGYGLDADARVQQRIVGELSAHRAAGLCVKTGRYVDEVPGPLCDAADAAGLPLVRVTKDVSLRPLTAAVAELLLEEGSPRRLTYVERVLEGEEPSGLPVPLPPGRPFVAYVIGFRDEDEERMRKTALPDDLLRAGPGRRAAIRPLPVVAERLATELGVGAFVGVSSVKVSTEELPAALREAAAAFRLGIELGASSQTASYEQLRIFEGLREAVAEGRLGEDLRHALAALSRHDAERGSELVRTLEAYLDAGGSQVQAARRLFVHRNTLRYRLKLVREQLGVDLDDPLQRLTLHMALKALRLRALD